ncbi:hypothetical protein KR044_006181 [Drosophila immigrans]|nr:hypothetical protein KR044_006181 [Drosophila immigrans]
MQQQQHQSHIAAAANHPPATTASDSLRNMEQLMHRIMPRLHSEDLQQPSSVNNNAVSLNQNLQQHFVDTLGQEWTQQHYDKYALAVTAQQQQLVPLWQQQQQQTYQMPHHLETGREELQQLNSQYQRLKYHEEEKIKCLNNTLKDVYADRLLSERQHAEYHRLFMHKMVESKKHEDSLNAQKNQLKRQLKEELDSLEQRIAEKRRQMQRAWQWQQQQQQQQQHEYHHHAHHHHQQYQQQHQQHLQQQQQLQLTYSQQQLQQQHQHFLRQLQPFQPGLQCFQDAFSQ